MGRRVFIVACLVLTIALVPRPVGAIAGGATTSKSWLVAITTPVGDRETKTCSGVLISSRFVLTAAHCAVTRLSSISIGGTSLTNGQTRAPDRTFTFPGYPGNEHVNLSQIADLKLIRLTSPSTKTPLPLADSSVAGDWSTGRQVRVYGYGHSRSSGGGGGTARQVAVTVRTFSLPGHKAHLHVGTQDRDVGMCKGDSGGPVVKKTRKGERLVGINSYPGGDPDKACRPGAVNVHAKVGSRGSVGNSPGYTWVARCVRDQSTCGRYPR